MSGMGARTPLPSGGAWRNPPAWYEQRPSEEKCEALAALLQDYFAKYPTDNKHTLADRAHTLTFVRRGQWVTVKWKLDHVGLPRDVQELIAHSITLLD